MKYIFKLSLPVFLSLIALSACSQPDKSTRVSPPVLVTQKIGEATISIDYSQPSVKGRIIGKDLEPIDGRVWRTGANEATVFDTDREVMVEGKPLPAGKYGLFTLVKGDEWTIIFNKTWKQWGAFSYKEEDDVLRVNVKAGKADSFAEKFTINISEGGVVTLLWGNLKVEFTVK